MQRSVTENLWTDQFTHAVVTHSIMLFFFIHCSADRKGHQVCRGPRLLLIPASQPSQEPHCRGGHRWQISGWCGKCHVGVFKRRTSIHPAVYKSCWLKCFNVCVVFLWRTSFQHKPVNLHFWAKMEKSLSQPWEAISHYVSLGGCQCGGTSTGHHIICGWGWQWDHHLRAGIHRQQTIIHLRPVCWRLHHHRPYPRLHGAETMRRSEN